MGRDLEPDHLDDLADREELRRRYYGLLQELRVVLPGVQVLLAFLLTAPFTNRFERLDSVGRGAYTGALAAAFAATVCFIAPTVFHRVGARTVRAARLRWGIRLMRAGLLLLAGALSSALWCVVRYVYDGTVAWIMSGSASALILSLWVAIPIVASREQERDRGDAVSQ